MKEAIETLLEKARKVFWNDEGWTWHKVETKKVLPLIDQALALLKQQPPEGEFTKKLREKYKYAIKQKLCVYAGAFEKVLDRLDRAEAREKDLLEALEQIAEHRVLVMDDEGETEADAMAKVAKAKKEG